MRQVSIAKRYALALFRVGRELNQVEDFAQQLLVINRCIEENISLKTVLLSPVVKTAQKKAVLASLFSRLSISHLVSNFIYLLIDRERLSALTMICLVFSDMTDEVMNQVRLQVKTAIPLGSYEDKLKTVFEKVLKQKVILEVNIDPEILGGLVIKIKDQFFDASLKRRLERLKEQILNQAVA